jgi:hypothetical protein
VSAHDGFDERFAVFDYDVEVDFAVFVLFAQLGFGGAERFGQPLQADAALLSLLFGLLQARVQLADACFV